MSHYSYIQNLCSKWCFWTVKIVGCTKITIRVCHGLVSYSYQDLLFCLEKYDYLVVSFDDAFNVVSKTGLI